MNNNYLRIVIYWKVLFLDAEYNLAVQHKP